MIPNAIKEKLLEELELLQSRRILGANESELYLVGLEIGAEVALGERTPIWVSSLDATPPDDREVLCCKKVGGIPVYYVGAWLGSSWVSDDCNLMPIHLENPHWRDLPRF